MGINYGHIYLYSLSGVESGSTDPPPLVKGWGLRCRHQRSMANRNGSSQGCKIRVKGRPGSEVIESCARSSSSSSRSSSPSKLMWSPHLKHFHCGASVGSRATAFDVGHRCSVKSRVMGVIKAMVTQCRSLSPWVWQPGQGQRHRPRISSLIGDHHRGVINIGCSLWHC